jgi:dihydrofolate reductase
MAKLVYSAITSLDGYTEDASGRFDWSAPDEEVHAYVNDLERPIGTYLLGRKMYDVMHVWQHPEEFAEDSAIALDYASIWQAADKVVYSTTLDAPLTPRTRIEREFDVDAVRALTASASADVSIGGPELAAHAFRAGLVDEVHLFLNPIVVGGGKPALPDGVRFELELLRERRFGNGVVHLQHRIRR